ncbi:uncharacterized protein LOC122851937 [Aphidius gifuensis]|uniref:uncharacterized protein LOC122851937 n=1 Tax=Aphidius gifuensis TaxID=684658 RepID=UPI001CDD7F3F|nr:uncharacterized protein LOC122851937 [Aphidius gifuensis]
MSGHSSKKRSRSRSQHRERSSDRKMRKMQEQLDSLMKMTKALIQNQQTPQKEYNKREETDDNKKSDEAKKSIEKPREISEIEKSSDEASHQEQEDVEVVTTVANIDLIKSLGDDPTIPKSTLNDHAEIKSRWGNWKNKGLPEKTKKEILEKYPRNGDMHLEAPKVNLPVPMTPMATKRDQHFIETQNCVGSAIGALSSAISMMLNAAPGEDIDQEEFSEYLSHTGQLLTDIFYQLSMTRKSFITPLMDKIYKSTLDEATPDEWLYGEKFSDQVKDAKVLEKTSTSIKASDKKFINRLNN